MPVGKLITIFILILFIQSCSQPSSPRSWIQPKTVILEVPGDGAFFPPKEGLPAIIVVRDINDIDVVTHEAGHAIWDAIGHKQMYK